MKRIKQYCQQNFLQITLQLFFFIVCVLSLSYCFSENFQKIIVKEMINYMVKTLILMAFIFGAFLFFTCGSKNQKIFELLKAYSSSVCIIAIFFYFIMEKSENYNINNLIDENLLLPCRFFWILTIFSFSYLIKLTFLNSTNKSS